MRKNANHVSTYERCIVQYRIRHDEQLACYQYFTFVLLSLSLKMMLHDDGFRATRRNEVDSGRSKRLHSRLWHKLSHRDDTRSANPLSSHLLHKGVTAKFMPKWPAIVTYTLVSGWTDETTEAFRDAVEKVVQLNPILTGRVYKHRPFPILHRKGETVHLCVQPGVFSLQNHNFVTVVDAPADFPSPEGMNCISALDLIEERINPLMGIHCESTGKEIAKKLPLFGAYVVRLKDHHACLAIKMSHSLGDGATVRFSHLTTFLHTYYALLSIIIDSILHLLNLLILALSHLCCIVS